MENVLQRNQSPQKNSGYVTTSLCTPKVILSTHRKLLCLSAGKESNHLSWFSEDMQTSYFGCFGHAWLQKPKMILSACRRLWCLSGCQK